ncbi:hypothetical protein D3C71_1809410 [compost metagenome]
MNGAFAPKHFLAPLSPHWQHGAVSLPELYLRRFRSSGLRRFRACGRLISLILRIPFGLFLTKLQIYLPYRSRPHFPVLGYIKKPAPSGRLLLPMNIKLFPEPEAEFQIPYRAGESSDRGTCPSLRQAPASGTSAPDSVQAHRRNG